MMTNEEIIRDYKQAAAPMKQIGILADLNQCSRQDIVKILREAGCELPKLYDKKKVDTPEHSALGLGDLVDNDIVRELIREKMELENENKKLKALIIKMIERELA